MTATNSRNRVLNKYQRKTMLLSERKTGLCQMNVVAVILTQPRRGSEVVKAVDLAVEGGLGHRNGVKDSLLLGDDFGIRR